MRSFKFFSYSSVLAAIVLAYLAFLFVNSPAEKVGRSVVIEVTLGEGFHKVSDTLHELGVITNPRVFYWLARVTGYSGKLREGEYSLDTSMRPMEVLKILASGNSMLHPFTIQEGLNSYDIGALLEEKGIAKKKDFLAVCHDKKFIKELLGEDLPTLEGYLYPETYSVTKLTGARRIADLMVRRFLKVYDLVHDAKAEGNWTRHQIVTLASMVEKETGASEERPLIASIFFNRLAIGMKLQSDPTVLYGILDQAQVYKANITRDDLHTPTAYNTYTRYGLPAGPIGNPGEQALRAVFSPGQTDYLYFVSRNDGTHKFSKSFKEHNKAVKEFQLNPEARKGKSWRDLAKKKIN